MDGIINNSAAATAAAAAAASASNAYAAGLQAAAAAAIGLGQLADLSAVYRQATAADQVSCCLGSSVRSFVNQSAIQRPFLYLTLNYYKNSNTSNDCLIVILGCYTFEGTELIV